MKTQMQISPVKIGKKRSSIVSSILANLVLMFFSLLILIPFILAFFTAFKTFPETLALPFQIFPDSFQLENFREILGRFDFPRAYFNTALNAITITVGQLFISSIAAYAFARMDFKLKNGLFMIMVTALMIPLQMILIPRYMLVNYLGWIDTYWAVIIPGIPSIWTTFFLRQHMQTLPKELDESARLDGCSHWGIYWRIILPLSKTVLVTSAILTVTWAWNDFLWPMIVLNSEEMSVLSMIVARVQGPYVTQYNLLMAAGMLAIIPMLILFLLLQRHFIESVAMTGLKS